MPGWDQRVMCGICRRRAASLVVRHWSVAHGELFSISDPRFSPENDRYLQVPKFGASGSMGVPCCSSCAADTAETVGVIDSGYGRTELW